MKTSERESLLQLPMNHICRHALHLSFRAGVSFTPITAHPSLGSPVTSWRLLWTWFHTLVSLHLMLLTYPDPLDFLLSPYIFSKHKQNKHTHTSLDLGFLRREAEREMRVWQVGALTWLPQQFLYSRYVRFQLGNQYICPSSLRIGPDKVLLCGVPQFEYVVWISCHNWIF